MEAQLHALAAGRQAADGALVGAGRPAGVDGAAQQGAEDLVADGEQGVDGLLRADQVPAQEVVDGGGGDDDVQ